MTSTLSIKNFFCLKNVKFKFSRKMFLIGPNSSGKSALAKAIRFLHINVIENYASDKTAFLIDDNTNLGTYSDIVFNHDIKKPVVFNFTFRSTLEEYYKHLDDDCPIIENNKLADDTEHNFESNLKEVFGFENIRDFLESISSSEQNLESTIRKNLSELNFSFYVAFSPDSQSRHLKLIKIKDNYSSAWISYKPSVKYKFNQDNEWEINWKLFDDIKLNYLFENLPLNFEYIFGYIYLAITDISKEINSVLWDFAKNVLAEDEFWNSFSLDEKKEILVKVFVQLIRFFKYFNVVIRSHFSTFNLKSPRYIPEYKYILKNGELPKIKDYRDLNLFLSKKEAKILSSEEETEEYVELMTEPEHLMWSEIFYFLQQNDFANYCYLKKNNVTGELRIVNIDWIDHNLTEAGSGFLNFFPILFQIYYRTNIDYLNNYLFIENPELHLNSNYITALASLLTSENVPLIVETNSEQLIKKIQMQIFKGELKRDEITFLYFKKHKGQTKIEQLKLVCLQSGLNDKAFFNTVLQPNFLDTSILSVKLISGIHMN